MKRPRDSQRAKVYKAEASAFKGETIEFKSTLDVAEFIKDILNNPRVNGTYGPYMNESLEIRSGAGRGASRATENYIAILRRHRMRWVVLHELAHTITRRRYGVSAVAGHGWEWAATYVDLIDIVMGKDHAARLKASFKEHRVRFSEKIKREATPEQLSRLAAARETMRLKKAA